MRILELKLIQHYKHQSIFKLLNQMMNLAILLLYQLILI